MGAIIFIFLVLGCIAAQPENQLEKLVKDESDELI